MQSFLCTSCGTVFNENVVGHPDYSDDINCGLSYPCPIQNCTGLVVEIDDMLVDVIKNMNRVGFMTVACCSGHAQDSLVKCIAPYKEVRTYILCYATLDIIDLTHEMLEIIAKSLPKGFKLDIDNYMGQMRFTIEKSTKCKTDAKVMRQIADNCANLLEWTENVMPDVVKYLYQKYEEDGGEYEYVTD